MDIKIICKCGGVIGGEELDSEKGIFPCTCKKRKNKKQTDHWKNGRETQNK